MPLLRFFHLEKVYFLVLVEVMVLGVTLEPPFKLKLTLYPVIVSSALEITAAVLILGLVFLTVVIVPAVYCA